MIIESCNSSIVRVANQLSLGADFVSSVIDFRDSSHCSIQVVWSGVDLYTGSFKLYGSLLRDESSFTDNDIDHSLYVIESGKTSKMWIYDRLSFRYVQLRWTKNTTTTGTVDLWAQGKKV